MVSFSQKRFATKVHGGSAAIDLWMTAVALVKKVPSPIGDDVRGHELARAVARILGIGFQDGRFEGVEHSWLWARWPAWKFKAEGDDHPPPVLDVYVPGALPQVQLVDFEYWGLPYKRVYVPGSLRDDIDAKMVDRLVEEMSR